MPQLQALVAGLFFLSESDAPLGVVSCPHPEGPLPSLVLLVALGEPAGTPVQVVGLPYFLRTYSAPDGVLGNPELAARYQALQDFKTQQLSQVHLDRVGSEPQMLRYAFAGKSLRPKNRAATR